jgi:hypothetical protein
MSPLDEALTLVKAAGYRVSKPKSKPAAKPKSRIGPVFVAKFIDGVVTRMTTFTPLDQLDWDRGVRLSQAAYRSRWRTQQRICTPYPIAEPVPPAIVSMHFERDGVVLARRPDSGATL